MSENIIDNIYGERLSFEDMRKLITWEKGKSYPDEIVLYPALCQLWDDGTEKRCWAFKSIFGSGWEFIEGQGGFSSLTGAEHVRRWVQTEEPTLEFGDSLFILSLKSDNKANELDAEKARRK